MLYILAVIIILYTASHFLFKKNAIYLRVRKYIDIATVLVTSVLVIAWVEIFHYSFLFIIYFFISLGIIVYLVNRLRVAETKKIKAEEVIKELKTEEKVLENEIEVLKDVKN
jgi:cell division protein FtsB